ncbi:MAG: sigma-70 family RNA polymerase sigma factor [Planctomycetota bacterium]
MVGAGRKDITRLLDDLAASKDAATERLLPLVYDELHGLARHFFERQGPGHTLQPTALVHEAYLKLVGNPDKHWAGRDHFFAVAANAMRQILVDHARRKRASKRGGDRGRVTLDEAISDDIGRDVDYVDLDAALAKLEAMDERKAKVATLRFFGGLTSEAVADMLGVSRQTVAGDWTVARAFLHQELQKAAGA